MKKIILILGLFILSGNHSFAASVPSFTTVTAGDLDNVAKEMNANFSYTSASSPASVGKNILPWLGIEFGLVAGITKTPSIDTLVTSATIDKIYHAGLFAAFGLPYGIGAETIIFPKKKIADVNVSYVGVAAKWTITDEFFQTLPIKWGVKAHYAKSTFEYGQTINNSSTSNLPVNVTVKIEDEVWGFNSSISHKFFDMLEPYAGIGYLSGEGKVSILGSTSATFFGAGIPSASQSASAESTSFQFFGGLEFNFYFLHLGAEAMRAFGTNNYTGKLSFAF